jgi:hypothetical protein
LTAGANLEFSATSSKEASVAQLVEHHLAKVDVESSNLFARSIFRSPQSNDWGLFVGIMKR